MKTSVPSGGVSPGSPHPNPLPEGRGGPCHFLRTKLAMVPGSPCAWRAAATPRPREAAAAGPRRRPAQRSLRRNCPKTLNGAMGQPSMRASAGATLGRPAQPAELLRQHLGGQRMPDRLRQVLRRFEGAFGPGIGAGRHPQRPPVASTIKSSGARAAAADRPQYVFWIAASTADRPSSTPLVRAAPCRGRCPRGRR